MIDWKRIADLKEELGEDDFEEVFDIFLDEVGDGVQGLDSTLEASALEAILHSIKGNAVTVGFAALADLASEGEINASRGINVALAPIIAAHQQSLAAYADGPNAS